MLRQIGELIAREHPDALLVSGDVFDTSQPRADVQQLFTDAILSYHKSCPAMVIVITAGNHDSASRHEIFQQPWRELNVHAVGKLHPDAPEEHIIKVGESGYIAAVPYAPDRTFPEGFYQRVIDAVPDDGLPLVMSAHTSVRGADFAGHSRNRAGEEREVIGNIDSLELALLGEGYDYLALGHIHNPQFVHGGNGRVRYCGSPIPVSFDERGSHGVSLVEISRRGEKPTVTHVPIENPRPLETIPADGAFTDWDTALQLLGEYEPKGDDYVRLNVETRGPLPANRRDQIARAVGERRITVCRINARSVCNPDEAVAEMTVEELQEQRPVDLARRYARQKGIEFTDEMEKMFNEVIRSINDEA